jgi:pimeloyl-ACP methyl ester carboxylesterase
MAATALLIHGAWQGAWAWDAFIPPFGARGWTCRAIDLPENGEPGAGPGRACMDSYVAHCASVLERPSVVIAHSGGGVIASQLAENFPDKVACVVYLAGMMLPSGVAFEDLLSDLAAETAVSKGIGPHLQWSDDGEFSSVPVQAALDIFLQDCPPDAARRAAERLRPQREAGRRLRATLTAERYGRAPRIYVEALEDRSVVLEVQRRMQTLSPGALTLSIETGHVPQLAQPERLAEMLGAALAPHRRGGPPA